MVKANLSYNPYRLTRKNKQDCIMSELMNLPKAEIQTIDNQSGFQVSEQNRLEILDDTIRRKYLTRLTEMEIAPVKDLPSLEDDLIDNVRMYHITEMVYQKGEPALDKFTTVFNTIAAYDANKYSPAIE